MRSVRHALHWLVAVGLLAGTGVVGAGTAARAEEPLFLGWTSLLASFTTGYDPSSSNECVAGKDSCIDKTIKEMERRFTPLADACDHNAVFALAYLRTTQTYKWARDQEGFFIDTPFVNHEDAVFARYYFDAYDAWAAGNREDVPKAWLTAFDAAAGHRVNGIGSMFLGMNAHVNRDLAFTLADIGLTFSDGTSRKLDHDKVDVFLNAVIDPMLAEAAARFDPGIDNFRDPLLLGYTSTFQMLAAWREGAWRNAERLVNAPDAATRAQVARSIEEAADLLAKTIKTATSYLPPLTTSASRDAYCKTHKGAAAPISYAFGTPSPW